MHYAVLVVGQPLDNLDYAMCSFGSESPNLLTKIAQPSWLITQVC